MLFLFYLVVISWERYVVVVKWIEYKMIVSRCFIEIMKVVVWFVVLCLIILVFLMEIFGLVEKIL